MQLDTRVKRFLHMVAAGSMQEIWDLNPPLMRQEFLRLAQVVDVKDIPIAKAENRELPGPAGPLPSYGYTPVTNNADRPAGFVYFHGGAVVFCNIETHDALCRMLANDSGCPLISVDSRLELGHKFPAAVKNSFAVTRWVSERALLFGIDPERVAVFRGSAGGTLAAVVCKLASQTDGTSIALQVLFCLVTDLSAESESRKAYWEGYFFDRTTMEWVLIHYCPAGMDLRDPRLSPLCASDPAGLPPPISILQNPTRYAMRVRPTQIGWRLME